MLCWTILLTSERTISYSHGWYTFLNHRVAQEVFNTDTCSSISSLSTWQLTCLGEKVRVKCLVKLLRCISWSSWKRQVAIIASMGMANTVTWNFFVPKQWREGRGRKVYIFAQCLYSPFGTWFWPISEAEHEARWIFSVSWCWQPMFIQKSVFPFILKQHGVYWGQIYQCGVRWVFIPYPNDCSETIRT